MSADHHGSEYLIIIISPRRSESKWYGGIATFILKIIVFFFSRHPNITMLDKIYVNISSKEITKKTNRKHIKVVSTKMDRETFDAITNVMDETNKKNESE